MPKYFGGVSFEKRTVKENGFEQDIVITMTEDEYKDRSYRDYLEESTIDRAREQLRKKEHIQRDPAKVANLVAAMKERTEYKERMKSEHPKKYF